MERAKLMKGESVLINGATGVSGRLAIQVAKHLGARRVIATGRNDASVAGLDALGADVLIPPDQPANLLTRAFRTEMVNGGVDVALDYLWGPSAESLIAAAAGHAVITLAAEDMQKAELYGAAVIKDNAHLIYVRAVHERNLEPAWEDPSASREQSTTRRSHNGTGTVSTMVFHDLW
jgi:NADPH:quinone reductase-like Zn-dependent oxidoreductase